MDRRDVLKTGTCTLMSLAVRRAGGAGTRGPGAMFARFPRSLAQLEREAGSGRLGVAVLDTVSGASSGYREHERFTMCSTFKFLVAAAVLRRVDRGVEHLDRLVIIPPRPLLGHSPLTEPHAGGQMLVSALCFAMLTQSDNTAANLLLESLGGPGGYTNFARSLGDTVTRLDRNEPALNEIHANDERDTTSPAATLADMRELLTGTVLSSGSRAQLLGWMTQNHTGDERLRKKLPAGWRAGDKTGSNGTDTNNDIAIFWPPDRGPVLVTAYLTGCRSRDEKRNAILARVGELVYQAVERRG